jgi:hypothetical protein
MERNAPGSQRRDPKARFLTVVREAHAVDPRPLAGALSVRGGALLSGFRSVLSLRERDPRAPEHLTALIGEFDEAIRTRLATMARELPDHDYYTTRDVVAGRGYRRVHTTALGAGALMMWGDVSGLDAPRHWRHGVATGILASLALGEHPIECDRAFPVGLLHDLGRLSLIMHPDQQPAVWTAPVLVADRTGRSVAAELGFPVWLCDALFSCELGARAAAGPEATVAAACVAATELGYPGLATEPATARPVEVARLHRLLDREGGAEWLESRIEAIQLAARGHLIDALTRT